MCLSGINDLKREVVGKNSVLQLERFARLKTFLLSNIREEKKTFLKTNKLNPIVQNLPVRFGMDS